MPSTEPERIGENIGEELVTIYVGKKRKEFTIHKKLICDKSEIILKAFTGAFQERDGVIHLPEEDSGSFSLFVDWLYRFTVPHGNTRDHFINLFKLYVFAEKMCINELANRTMDRIRCTMYHNKEAQVTLPLASYVYKNISTDSPMRKYCIPNLVYNMWDGFTSTFPYENDMKLILDLAQSQQDLVLDFFAFIRDYPDKISPSVRGQEAPDENCKPISCEFHRHGPKEVCDTVAPTSVSHDWDGPQTMMDFTKISD